RCYECHGEKKQKAGVRFDQRDSVFHGGDAGKPLVTAGKSTESILIQKITSTDPDEMMPPKGERLTAEQIATLKAWIEEGANWPQQEKQKKTHWAYVKPAPPALPKVGDMAWPISEIDYFVLARLEKEGLRPAPPADPAVLLRRVSLDLIGLPPTIEEVDMFLNDRSERAYENAVDRLLNSVHYGERWARPWLDLARYADTQGYEKDNRRTMWPFRDWVIKALNENMPFDEFTIEQLAGDLLPNPTQNQKVATGFHRNTMTNTEGGTDNEEFRHEAIIDRINTTMSVWMGTTLNCAQCHNHKYDPFTSKDYYNFYAFLNQTADADSDDEKPTMKVIQPWEEKKVAQLREATKDAEDHLKEAAALPGIIEMQREWETKAADALTNWQIIDPVSWSSKGGATFTKTESKSLLAGGANAANDVYTVTANNENWRIMGFRLEVLETGDEKALGRAGNGSFVLSKFEVEADSQPVRLKAAAADYSQENYPATNLLAGAGNGWAIDAADKNKRVRRSVYFEPEKPVEAKTLKFTLRHDSKFPEANIARFRLYATSDDEPLLAAQIPAEVRSILLAQSRDEAQKKKLHEYYTSIAPGLSLARDAVAKAKAAEKKYYDSLPITSVMEELKQPRETFFRVRGAYLSKGDKVFPATPAVLHKFNPAYPSNRLGLAYWLVDTNNPLTARVIVNRFWEQYFGRGIMETVEDFGTQSEPPSHPELLDWLATDFMASGWNMKAMHKQIVMSATYRQASKASPELHQRDPYNRLYARGPRVRLEAEMIRDQALAVSGLLSRKVGGPSVFPPQPEGLWQVVYSGDKWDTSKGEDKYRRGLYTFWRRTIPHPAMTTFDAPSREFCVLRRSRSNTPLQALTTLNDAAYVEAAQALARRVVGRSCAKDSAELAFRLCLARKPTAAELERLAKLYETELKHYRANPEAAKYMAGTKESNAAELAAWTVVGNVLLNLDEMITKG
ncbi:MAG TPA: PSD1 and planctomycete cytochrome C domain-containing protein, partial [Verrucomicrobiae bacterium]|nr:PSD1 and planctomycete cytochrome C domain-containing protein [Verrucomicrobiae bacterium]